ncbi:MAG: histidine triad nucleotide-binding protein [Clostridiales bacterium]|nr:histidine triad nucleotide-binding protein [Clostridiales bacterium]
MEDCVFCKILSGEIPSKRFYEDDLMIVIADIEPKAQKHYLAIPKKHYKYFTEMTENDAIELGKCIRKIGEIASLLGLDNGFRVVVNQGDDAQQTVPHLHLHILGGQKLIDIDYKKNA